MCAESQTHHTHVPKFPAGLSTQETKRKTIKEMVRSNYSGLSLLLTAEHNTKDHLEQAEFIRRVSRGWKTYNIAKSSTSNKDFKGQYYRLFHNKKLKWVVVLFKMAVFKIWYKTMNYLWSRFTYPLINVHIYTFQLTQTNQICTDQNPQFLSFSLSLLFVFGVTLMLHTHPKFVHLSEIQKDEVDWIFNCALTKMKWFLWRF